MIGQTHATSAKILAFPAGGRKGLKSTVAAVATLRNDNRRPLPVVDTDSWYHQAAMAEEERDRSH